MKKAYLVFDTSPENGGTEELLTAINGYNYKSVIDDLLEWLRKMRKYEDKTLVSIEEVEQHIRENMP